MIVDLFCFAFQLECNNVWYGRCTFVSICNISLFFLLKMSDIEELELEPRETVDVRIACCQAVLKRPDITEKDRRYVQQMLNKAIAIKKKKQGRTISSLLSKYGVPPEAEEVIEVDGSPDEPDKPATKINTRKKKAEETPKCPPSSKKARTDPSPSKVAARGKVTKVKGPPTKRTQTEEKKERDPLADDSDADMDAGSDYRPSAVGSGEERDPPATPSSKKGRGRPSSSKKATTAKS